MKTHNFHNARAIAIRTMLVACGLVLIDHGLAPAGHTPLITQAVAQGHTDGGHTDGGHTDGGHTDGGHTGGPGGSGGHSGGSGGHSGGSGGHSDGPKRHGARFGHEGHTGGQHGAIGGERDDARFGGGNGLHGGNLVPEGVGRYGSGYSTSGGDTPGRLRYWGGYTVPDTPDDPTPEPPPGTDPTALADAVPGPGGGPSVDIRGSLDGPSRCDGVMAGMSVSQQYTDRNLLRLNAARGLLDPSLAKSGRTAPPYLMGGVQAELLKTSPNAELIGVYLGLMATVPITTEIVKEIGTVVCARVKDDQVVKIAAVAHQQRIALASAKAKAPSACAGVVAGMPDSRQLAGRNLLRLNVAHALLDPTLAGSGKTAPPYLMAGVQDELLSPPPDIDLVGTYVGLMATIPVTAAIVQKVGKTVCGPVGSTDAMLIAAVAQQQRAVLARSQLRGMLK